MTPRHLFPILGAAALLTAGVAAAQPAPPPPGGQTDAPQQAAPAPEGPPPAGGPGFYGRMHRPFMGPPPGMMGMRPPPPPRGTHFHFGRGDAVVDVRCAASESTRACADATASLLDKLQGAVR